MYTPPVNFIEKRWKLATSPLLIWSVSIEVKNN